MAVPLIVSHPPHTKADREVIGHWPPFLRLSVSAEQFRFARDEEERPSTPKKEKLSLSDTGAEDPVATSRAPRTTWTIC